MNREEILSTIQTLENRYLANPDSIYDIDNELYDILNVLAYDKKDIQALQEWSELLDSRAHFYTDLGRLLYEAADKADNGIEWLQENGNY